MVLWLRRLRCAARRHQALFGGRYVRDNESYSAIVMSSPWGEGGWKVMGAVSALVSRKRRHPGLVPIPQISALGRQRAWLMTVFN